MVSASITIFIPQICYSGLSIFTDHVKLDARVLESVVCRVLKDSGHWVSVRTGGVGVCEGMSSSSSLGDC